MYKNEVLGVNPNGLGTYDVNGFDPQFKISFNIHYTINNGVLYRTQAWFYYNQNFYEFNAVNDKWHKIGRGLSPYKLNNLFTKIENDIKLKVYKGE